MLEKTFSERYYQSHHRNSQDSRNRSKKDSTGSRFDAYLDKSYFGFNDLSRQLTGDRDSDSVRTIGMSSKASHTLMAQLVTETRSLSGVGADEGGAYHPKRQARDTATLLHFMQKHRHHPEKVHTALRQAYMVLDLARMLFLARVLVSTTQPATTQQQSEEEKTAALTSVAAERAAAAAASRSAHKVGVRKEYHPRESRPQGESEAAVAHKSALSLSYWAAQHRARLLHPLDEAYLRVEAYKEYEEGMKALVARVDAKAVASNSFRVTTASTSVPTSPTKVHFSRSAAQAGSNTADQAAFIVDQQRRAAANSLLATDQHLRLKLCDLLKEDDLACFFRLDETVSLRYFNLKKMVLKGLVLLAKLKRDEGVLAFLRRLEVLMNNTYDHEGLDGASHAGYATGASTGSAVEGSMLYRAKTALTSGALLALPFELPSRGSSSADGDEGLHAPHMHTSDVGVDNNPASSLDSPRMAEADKARGVLHRIRERRATAARTARGSGMTMLLDFLCSLSLRDVLCTPPPSIGGSNGQEEVKAALNAIVKLASALHTYDSGKDQEEEDEDEEVEGKEEAVNVQLDSSVMRTTSSTAASSPERPNKPPKKPRKSPGPGGVSTALRSNTPTPSARAETGSASTTAPRASRKRPERVPKSPRITKKQSRTKIDAVEDEATRLARERRAVHGFEPTEQEIVEIESLLGAPPMILQGIVRRLGIQAPALNPESRRPEPAGDATSSAQQQQKTDLFTSGAITAHSYLMSANLVVELKRAYHTASVLGWLVQALAGICSRRAFYEPMVRDWAGLARLSNPLCVVPVIVRQDVCDSDSSAGVNGAGISSLSSIVGKYTGSSPVGGDVAQRGGDVLWMLTPLLRYHDKYVSSLLPMLREAIHDHALSATEGEYATSATPPRRLLVGGAAGLPLRLAGYRSLHSSLLSCTSDHLAAVGGGSAAASITFGREEGEDDTLNESYRTLSHLLELGCEPCVVDDRGRIPLVVAALTGRADMVREMLLYSTAAQLRPLQAGELRQYLIWHVLMAAPPPPPASAGRNANTIAAIAEAKGADDGVGAIGGGTAASQDCTNTAARGYEEVVKLLLEHDFHYQPPPYRHRHHDNFHISCLQLAVLKRLEIAVRALSKAIVAGDATSEQQASTRSIAIEEGTCQGFPSLSLALLWPGVRLHVIDELARAVHPPDAAIQDDANSASKGDDLPSRATPMKPSKQSLPSPVFLAHLLPTNFINSARVHAYFVAKHLGCGVSDEEEKAETLASMDNEKGPRNGHISYVYSDTLLSMASTLSTTFSPAPVGKAPTELRGECPVWRAARSSIGQLLLALPSALQHLDSTDNNSATASFSAHTTPHKAAPRRRSNSQGSGGAASGSGKHGHSVTTPGPSPEVYLSHGYHHDDHDTASSVGTSAAGSSGKYGIGGGVSSRLTPGKVKAQERASRRRIEDTSFQQELEEREIPSRQSSTSAAGAGIDYDHYWSIFHFSVASTRADITSLIFRKFHLYADTSSQGEEQRRVAYPSPAQLGLLATFYNHPQALMAIMLYSSTAAAVAAGYGHRREGMPGAGTSSGGSQATRLFIGDFLDRPNPFPFATSLVQAGSESGQFKARAVTTPLQVAIHYGLGDVLVYLCEIGVNIPYSSLLSATLGGTVSERHLVALFTAYFLQSKDLRNSDVTIVGMTTSAVLQAPTALVIACPAPPPQQLPLSRVWRAISPLSLVLGESGVVWLAVSSMREYHANALC